MEKKAEQYYPTYISVERDILLKEFEEAQKIANSQTNLYSQVTSVLLATLTFTFTFLLDKSKLKSNLEVELSSQKSVLFFIVIFIFGYVLLMYFVDLQKQITINARKVVTLRTLLGLDYGHIHLTLPNWRVEGANNPFVIKYFNGWLKFKTMPLWLLTISVNLIWFIISEKMNLYYFDIGKFSLIINKYYIHIFITIFYILIFRRNLYDRHETTYLNLVLTVFYIFKIKYIDNIEYLLYRAKLSYLELDRLDVKYNNLIKILVEIEDKDFYSNASFSIKALVRGLLSRFAFFRKKYKWIENGGSTISMQLLRSLFISTKQNKYLRKIGEILLSVWISKQFSKTELLKIYIASVRYERGVLGLSNGIKHFFGELKGRNLSNEEAFFLVERLSNISSTINEDRINSLILRTSLIIDKSILNKIYQDQIDNKRLRRI